MTTTWNENDHPRTINGVPGAGQFEGKTSTPSPLSLTAPGANAGRAGRPVDISSLTETPRTVTPEEHGIKGLGNIDLSRSGNDLRIDMNLPEGLELPQDMAEWEMDGREVVATAEMESVIEDHLGIYPADNDALAIKNGRPVYTRHESYGGGGEIDPEDLQAWSEGFVALADPDIQESLAQDIVDRYVDGR